MPELTTFNWIVICVCLTTLSGFATFFLKDVFKKHDKHSDNIIDIQKDYAPRTELNSATAALRAEDKEIDARIKEHERDINEIKRTYATKGEMNDIEKSFQNENRMTCEKTETNRKDIQYIQQNYATKNDLKDIKTELRDDYKKLVVDVAEIKDNYIRKDDFYRTISDLSRTVDKVYELLIKEKGGVGIGKQG